MLEDTRWAARYQFLEDLWRGRDRLLLDPELEGLLRDGGSGPGNASPEAVAELFDELVPKRSVRESVYVMIESAQRAAEFANARAGTTFVGRDEGIGMLRGGAFDVAVLHVPSVDDDALELVETLVRQCRRGKTGVVVFTGEAAGGMDFDGASAFVDTHMRGARLFGVAEPQLTALYDFGGGEGDDDDVDLATDESGLDEEEAYDRALERAERAWSDEDDGGEDEVPIDFDNRLGADPSMRQWVVVLGSSDLGRGLTLVELPPRPAQSSTRVEADDDSASARAAATQVQEARRQADQAAIERQQLLEQLEDAHERIAALEESREEVAGVQDSARLDAALAAQQSLEWELTKVRSELEKERARPVGELEAELAALRARLAEQGTAPVSAATALREPRGSIEVEAAPTGPLLAELDRLLARVERGGIASMALHRSLVGLRRRISMGR